MDHQNIHNQDKSLVLSSDAKPRLKWTPELHQRFVNAVSQLGGPEKATPKNLMKAMNIHGLTLFQLKSHLQKYRLGKSQDSPVYCETKQEEYVETRVSDFSIDDNNTTRNPINESLQIAQALQIQMEVQRKLHEQIEVQRHLQLRIEAQGKYLQSVLRKAQDTLSGYKSSSFEVEVAKAELSKLVSMVDSGCPGSCLSALTQPESPSLGNIEMKLGKAMGGGSLESSLTSCESSKIIEETILKRDIDGNDKKQDRNDAVLLPLMEMSPERKKKRSWSTVSDANNFVEGRCVRRLSAQESENEESRKFGWWEKLDLNNNQCIDLNWKGAEQSNVFL